MPIFRSSSAATAPHADLANALALRIPRSSRRRQRQSAIAGWLLALAVAGGAHAAGTVGTGTAASCTEAALNTALTGGGNITFNCGGAATIVLTTTKNLTVDTNIDGGGQITLDGNATVRHFYATGMSNLTLAGLTLYNGKTSAGGGALLVDTAVNVALTNVALNLNQATFEGGAISAPGGAKLTLTDVIANGNQTGSSGGVIFAGDATTLSMTRVSAGNNKAHSSGGVVHMFGTSLSIDSSAFGGNSATGFGSAGGAVYFNPTAGGGAGIVNSTFEGNSAGGGVSGTGAAFTATSNATGTINNSTFANNSGQGTIEVAQTSNIHLRNSIVSNTISNQNCYGSGSGALVNDGNNIQFGGTIAQSCGAGIPVVDPKLGPFANNGGFTNTMALLAGSPAIDAGNNASCATIDQRGIARPIGPACDIGAYEAPAAGIPPAITNGPAPNGTVGTPYSFTYTATGSTPMTFSLAGTIPPGLMFTAAGAIVGTPTAAGTYTGSITVKNGTLPDAAQNFSITIAAAPVPTPTASAPTLDAWALFALMASIAAVACFAMPKE